MIVPVGPLAQPAARLLAQLAPAHRVLTDAEVAALSPGTPLTVAVSDGPFMLDLRALIGTLARHPLRLLVLSRLGAHPDARTASLKRLWRIEESARAIAAPVLTLRFAPLVGLASPLWFRLRARGSAGRAGRKLLNPVAEVDAVETLRRALDGRARWEGWYEVAGEAPLTLEEMAVLARAAGPPLNPATGAWEPPLEEMLEHRLAESGPWLEHFAMTATRVAEQMREWAA